MSTLPAIPNFALAKKVPSGREVCVRRTLPLLPARLLRLPRPSVALARRSLGEIHPWGSPPPPPTQLRAKRVELSREKEPDESAELRRGGRPI